jgi:polar amino acid transport system substrate-binding protein
MPTASFVRPSAAGYRRLALVLVFALAPWTAGDGAEPPTPPEIEYATPNPSVWTIHTDANGEPLNPLYRVAGELFTKAGIPWHPRSYPAARMFKYLQEGTAQFSMLVKAPVLETCCLLSRQPVTVLEIRVYHLVDKRPINKLDDLVGSSIITIHGYSYGGLLGFVADKRNRITDNVAPNHTAAFKMLAQQRADYVIDYAGPASEVIAADLLPGLRSEVLSRQPVYLVLVRSYPDAAGVMARLERIADTLEVDKLMRAGKAQTDPRRPVD